MHYIYNYYIFLINVPQFSLCFMYIYILVDLLMCVSIASMVDGSI